MPLEANNIYAVQFVYNFNTVECRNVQFYRCSVVSDVISLTEAAGYIGDLAGPLYAAITPADVIGESVIVEDVTLGLEFGTAPWSWTGLDAGESCPPYVAYGIRLNRGNKTTRNGYKRIAGVPESAQDAGDLNQVTITALETLANDLFVGDVEITLPDDRTFTFVPIIVGRNVAGQLDLTRTQNVQSATVKTKTTSQVTRKYE